VKNVVYFNKACSRKGKGLKNKEKVHMTETTFDV
jgi:hypothetical protein